MQSKLVLARIRAEYLEMPGLQLTFKQVVRLCGADPTPCQEVLDTLVSANFLRMKPNGMYARTSDGEIPRPRPAQAGLAVSVGAPAAAQHRSHGKVQGPRTASKLSA